MNPSEVVLDLGFDPSNLNTLQPTVTGNLQAHYDQPHK
jgi:hypothetical protein